MNGTRGLKHSVALIKEKCVGCTDCIKRCPTEAIRVRQGKAVINEQKCIDCGLCIKVCTHRAKQAMTQKMDLLKKFEYKIILPAPSLYTQFIKVDNVNVILTALKRLGFDDVFEVSAGAQAVTAATRKLIEEGGVTKPAVSSACPAVVRLISMRFPSLIENVVPIIAPVEACAIAARERAIISFNSIT